MSSDFKVSKFEVYPKIESKFVLLVSSSWMIFNYLWADLSLRKFHSKTVQQRLKFYVLADDVQLL